MKTELSKIAQDFEQGKINEGKARTLLLGLLGVINAKRTVCHTCEEDIADYFVPTLDDLKCPECGNKWHTDL